MRDAEVVGIEAVLPFFQHQWNEACLPKMPVRRHRGRQPVLFHNNKRDTIRKTPFFVISAPIERNSLFEKKMRNSYNLEFFATITACDKI